MTKNEVDIFPLRVAGVTAGGKRKFDAQGKRKLVDDLPEARRVNCRAGAEG